MKLSIALNILLAAISQNSVVSKDFGGTSIEDAVGAGCKNMIEFTSMFVKDGGEECDACEICDGYDLSSIFQPKGICVECTSVENTCKRFNVMTSFESPWNMRYLPLSASNMPSEFDPKHVFIQGSNDSVTWHELFNSQTKTLLEERNDTVEFIFDDNDANYKVYKFTFTLNDDVSKMHLGHLGVVPAYTKTCTAKFHSAITGDVVKAFETSAPTKEPTASPTTAPTDAPGYVMTNTRKSPSNIRTAVNKWVSDQGSAMATYGHISTWDVSQVKDMENVFYGKLAFNDDISRWNVSGVTKMTHMFFQANRFNGNLSKWDTSNVKDMWGTFSGGTAAFNGDITTWNTNNVTNMQKMFVDAYVFNRDLSKWNVNKVKNMEWMFNRARKFSHTLCWDLSGKNTHGMFVDSKGSAKWPC